HFCAQGRALQRLRHAELVRLLFLACHPSPPCALDLHLERAGFVIDSDGRRSGRTSSVLCPFPRPKHLRRAAGYDGSTLCADSDRHTSAILSATTESLTCILFAAFPFWLLSVRIS